MSNLSDHVSLVIQKNTVGISQAGFGTPLIISHSVSWTERTRDYTDLLDIASDFAIGTPEYLAAEAMFSQTPCPELVKVGRASNKPTQQYTVDVALVVNSDPYDINVVGPGITATTAQYMSDGSASVQEIHVGLVTALNAVVGLNYLATFAPSTVLTSPTFSANDTGSLFTAASHGLNTGDGPYQVSNSGGTLPAGLVAATNYWIIKIDANTFQLASSLANALAVTFLVITTNGAGTQTLNHQAGTLSPFLPFLVTGTAAGNWFSLEVTDPNLLSIKQSHADPGLTADLNAIALKDNDWYALATNFNSPTMVAAAATWIETQQKIYLVDVNETAAITTEAGNGDTLDNLHTLSFSRTSGSYHPSPANMLAAAWLGRMLPIDPGQDDWKFKPLAGVAPVTLTETDDTNLRARSANSFETVAGQNITWEGTVADGDFIDNTRGIDWLQNDMTTAVFAALVNAQKVPFTDNGIALIQNEVEGSLKRGIKAGVLTNNPAPVITVPKAADVDENDRALRILPDIKFTANLAGAIHKVKLNGVVSV